MRYKVELADRDLRRAFRQGEVYDERVILKRLAGMGLKAVRPNGSDRTRGSRVLHVYQRPNRKGNLVAAFAAEVREDVGVVKPIKVGYL